MAEDANAKAAEAKLKTEEANAKAAEVKMKAEEANAKVAEAKLKTEDANAKAAEAKLEAVETTARTAGGAYAKAVEARRKADDARARAAEDLADEVAKLTGAMTDQQAKVDAAEVARRASAEAEARQTDTAASMFISRKTQRLYVRQAFEPVLEVPVTIQDPGRPIGTYVFTATGNIDGTADLRWTVVSLKGRHGDSRAGAARNVPNAEPPPADANAAKAALDRIAIPAEVVDRIAGIISPRSSVIVSDEALSPETGKGTVTLASVRRATAHSPFSDKTH